MMRYYSRIEIKVDEKEESKSVITISSLPKMNYYLLFEMLQYLKIPKIWSKNNCFAEENEKEMYLWSNSVAIWYSVCVKILERDWMKRRFPLSFTPYSHSLATLWHSFTSVFKSICTPASLTRFWCISFKRPVGRCGWQNQ